MKYKIIIIDEQLNELYFEHKASVRSTNFMEWK